MKKWKYYSVNDPNKETCGTLHAEDINEAYAIASRIKQLPVPKFKELFNIERL